MNETRTITITDDEYRRLYDAIHALSMKLLRYYSDTDFTGDFKPIDDLLADFLLRFPQPEVGQ